MLALIAIHIAQGASMGAGGDQESGEELRGREEGQQDRLVERLWSNRSQPPQAVLTLAGLLGNSDRPGYQRLYFNRVLDYYGEFRTEDVVHTEPIPPEHPPLVGEQATRATLKHDATIEYTRVRSLPPIDEFDLDVRLNGLPELLPMTRRVPVTALSTRMTSELLLGDVR